jgi:hypothetical protein
MANWLHLAWGYLRTQEDFIKKAFDATVLIRRDGTHSLSLKRLGRPYDPIFMPAAAAAAMP